MKKYILLLFLFCLALGNEKNWFTSANIWAHIPGRVVTQNYNLSTTINTLVVPTSFKTDQVLEKTSAHGVSVDGLIIKDGGATVKALTALKADLINETTSAHGVTVDGVLIKDNGAVFGAAVSGVTILTATTVNTTALSGTIQTAAQAKITSVGTLTSLIVSGALTATASTANIGLKIDSGTVFPTAVVGRIFLDTSVPAVYISLDGVNWTRFGNFLN